MNNEICSLCFVSSFFYISNSKPLCFVRNLVAPAACCRCAQKMNGRWGLPPPPQNVPIFFVSACVALLLPSVYSCLARNAAFSFSFSPPAHRHPRRRSGAFCRCRCRSAHHLHPLQACTLIRCIECIPVKHQTTCDTKPLKKREPARRTHHTTWRQHSQRGAGKVLVHPSASTYKFIDKL